MPTGKCCCCSKDSPTQVITPRRRKNGWSRPWNFMQFFSWIIIIILAAISTYVAVPLPFFPLVPTFVLFLHVWVIFWIFLLTSMDPGDGPRDVVPAKFDRKKHSHVIENKYCHVCQRKVEEGTKHCRYCNKCIPGFDHHCKWLNNCVGRKNYRFFIILVSSLTASSLILLCLFISALTIFIVRTSNTPIDNPQHGGWLFADASWFFLCILAITCHAVVFGLAAHLLTFHFMLWRKGLTTLAYILQRRDKRSRSSGSSGATRTNSSQYNGPQAVGSLPLPGPRNPLRSSRSVADSSQCLEVMRQDVGTATADVSRESPSPEVVQMSTLNETADDPKEQTENV